MVWKTAEKLYALYKDAGSVEARELIMKLREDLNALREELNSTREENLLLKQQIKTSKTLIYEAPFYWLQDEHTKDGPFCQLCCDLDSKHIRMQKDQQGLWKCLNCNNHFGDAATVEQANTILRSGLTF